MLSVCSCFQQRWRRGLSAYLLGRLGLQARQVLLVRMDPLAHKVLLPQLLSSFQAKELEVAMEQAQRRVLASLVLRVRQAAQARRERRVQQAHRVYLVKLEALVRRGRPDPPVPPDQQEQ